MRTLIILALTILLDACTNECSVNDIDFKVNNKLTHTFENGKPDLWKNLEKEFYRRLTALQLFDSQKDSLKAFTDLMVFITEQGFPPAFFVDTSDINTKELLISL